MSVLKAIRMELRAAFPAYAVVYQYELNQPFLAVYHPEVEHKVCDVSVNGHYIIVRESDEMAGDTDEGARFENWELPATWGETTLEECLSVPLEAGMIFDMDTVDYIQGVIEYMRDWCMIGNGTGQSG